MWLNVFYSVLPCSLWLRGSKLAVRKRTPNKCRSSSGFCVLGTRSLGSGVFRMSTNRYGYVFIHLFTQCVHLAYSRQWHHRNDKNIVSAYQKTMYSWSYSVVMETGTCNTSKLEENTGCFWQWVQIKKHILDVSGKLLWWLLHAICL